MTVYGSLIGGDTSPLGKTYLSVRATVHGVERPFVVGTPLRLQVRKNGLLVARAGCNEFSGLIMLDDGVLRFEYGIVTQMNCGEEMNAQDEWIVEFLTSEPSWVVDGDVLTFTSGGTTPELRDRPIADPDLPLDGTTWAVKSVVLGKDGPFRPYALVGPATIVLDGARATGFTGASPFTATVTRSGDTLTFTDLVITPGRATDRAAELERDVVDNLRTPLTYSIELNHLKLRGPTGATGLNLIALWTGPGD